MTRNALFSLLIVGLVAGCGLGQSRLNPFNWFGGDESVPREQVVEQAADDPRPLVSQVTSLKIDRTAGGVLVTATGLPPTQQYYDGELVPLNDELPVKGVLVYELRATKPPGTPRVSTAASREMSVGTFISDQALAGVRSIQVLGAQNSRSVRRR